MTGKIDRRSFLRASIAGGAGAVALTGCKGKEREIHKVISQLDSPDLTQLGTDHSTWYASACTACEAGCGIHVRVRQRCRGRLFGRFRLAGRASVR